ncbi:MAG: protein kinase domain-containing protein, partial [Terriglobales bacterium]
MGDHAVGYGAPVDQTLGHYRIAEKVGAGGMGEVYRARDQHLARDVAIKVLPPGTLIDESARKRFRKEALILSQLNHPNIATIHDFDTQEGVDFLVMEYIPGITLNEMVAGRPLPEKEVLRLGAQLADGLAAAHDQGVVHRDLKPGNLRVTSDGRLKILDFGLAKLWHPVTASAATDSFSETQAMAGTLPYMAPEQLLGGAIDARTDIHAAGSVLYEMATGQRPFSKLEHAQLITAILRQAPTPPGQLNPQVSPELARIIGKCLEKEPENRYQSAKELAVDLRRLGVPSTGAPVGAVEPKKLKGIVKAAMLGVGVLLVGALVIAFYAGGWSDRALRQGGGPQISSLAVLPLANFSHDPEQDYFADGMTEALITDLAKTAELRVISRTSVMRYKGTQKPLPEIARELNVDAVVEGSVQRSGSRVRITAQLIRGATDQHLWAESYERDLRDILGLQDEVAHAIAQRVESKLNPKNQMNRERARPVEPEAYEAYLKGIYYMEKRTPESLRKSAEYFQRAIAKDPSYAPAYAGLADFYNLASNYGVLAPEESFPKARTLAVKALEIDDSLAEGHFALASVLANGYDWKAAETEFRRALELNPGSAQGHYWYGFTFLGPLGRHTEAISEMQRARELDPLSLVINANLGATFWLAGEYDQAIQQCLKTLEMYPHSEAAHLNLAWAYQQKGMFEQGVREMQKEMADSDDNGTDPQSLSQLARAYVLAGKSAEAQQTIAKLNHLSKLTYVSPYDRATIDVALGRKDRALAELEQACEKHDDRMIWIGTDPRFEGLHSDPRFQALLRR